jgi:hypothetical protein
LVQTDALGLKADLKINKLSFVDEVELQISELGSYFEKISKQKSLALENNSTAFHFKLDLSTRG